MVLLLFVYCVGSLCCWLCALAFGGCAGFAFGLWFGEFCGGLIARLVCRCCGFGVLIGLRLFLGVCYFHRLRLDV